MALISDVLSGVKWTASSRVLEQGLQFGLSVLLMRLLGPEAFGLIAMVLVFTGFAGVFQDLGFSSALIHFQDASEEHRSTAFWCSVALGICISLALSASAGLIAGFYDLPQLEFIVVAVSLSFAMSAFGSVPRAILQKRMLFARIAIVESVATIVSGGSAALAALGGLGVWALVIQLLLFALISAVGLLLWTPWTPSWRVSRSALDELWRYGAGLTGFAVVNYWARRADDLLIGKFFGSAALGLYSRAYSLMLLPLSQIMRVLIPVVFPAFASVQHDHVRVKRGFLRLISIISFISFPLMFGLCATAEPFVMTIFGPDWSGLIPLIRILSIAGALGALANPLGVIFTSQGQTGAFFRIGLFSGGTTVVMICLGVILGDVVTVAWFYLAASTIVTIPNYLAAGKLIGMTLGDALGAVWANFASAVLMALVVALVAQQVLSFLPHPVSLLMLTGLGAGLYSMLSVLWKLPGLRDLTSLLRGGRGGVPSATLDASA